MPKISDVEISRRIQAGLTVSGSWTYHARVAIRAKGGYWHVPANAWLMPDRKSMLEVLMLQPNDPAPQPSEPLEPPAPEGNPYSLPEKVKEQTRQANQTLEALEHWWGSLDDEQRDAVTHFIDTHRPTQKPARKPKAKKVTAPAPNVLPVLQAVGDDLRYWENVAERYRSLPPAQQQKVKDCFRGIKYHA